MKSSDFCAVRRLELTSFFICEMTGEDHKQFGEYVEDYLSDGVMHLVMERAATMLLENWAS